MTCNSKFRRYGAPIAACVVLIASAPCGRAAETRLKELVSIEGVRENQLIGYGLVVGLHGTGDRQQTLFSTQTLANLLRQMGVSVPATAMRVNNTAAVMVTAMLPPFAQPGTRFDIAVSSIGDASNLQGGLLVMTTLKGIDGQTYAIGQGAVVTGGFAVARSGSSQSVNHPTAGRVPGGATVERSTPPVRLDQRIKLQLHNADFTTAARIAEALNRRFGAEGLAVATANSSALVTVTVPPSFSSRSTEFIAELERLKVEPDRAAKVVINEKTGTIALGNDARIAPIAVMHGNLTVQIQTNYAISQPAPFSQGTTAVVPEVSIAAKEENARNIVLKEGATVEQLVKALAAIGSTTRDVIAILENLRAAGALDAELEVI